MRQTRRPATARRDHATVAGRTPEQRMTPQHLLRQDRETESLYESAKPAHTRKTQSTREHHSRFNTPPSTTERHERQHEPRSRQTRAGARKGAVSILAATYRARSGTKQLRATRGLASRCAANDQNTRQIAAPATAKLAVSSAHLGGRWRAEAPRAENAAAGSLAGRTAETVTARDVLHAPDTTCRAGGRTGVPERGTAAWDSRRGHRRSARFVALPAAAR
ncbi:hypothetical protein FGB62_530g00 [Gracilaria domingensis]|nr:hypothetical protein FGB62_530g00 [Gracilaria domingensis]